MKDSGERGAKADRQYVDRDLRCSLMTKTPDPLEPGWGGGGEGRECVCPVFYRMGRAFSNKVIFIQRSS